MATGDKVIVGLPTGSLEYVVSDDEVISTRIEQNGCLQILRDGVTTDIFAPYYWQSVTFTTMEKKNG
jgi:hypothetical protein